MGIIHTFLIVLIVVASSLYVGYNIALNKVYSYMRDILHNISVEDKTVQYCKGALEAIDSLDRMIRKEEDKDNE